MRMRSRPPGKASRIKATYTTPTTDTTVIGKYREMNEKNSAVVEINDQRGFLVHSGPTASPNTYGNWQPIQTAADSTAAIAFLQYESGTTAFTKSNAKSGTQAIFATQMGTADNIIGAGGLQTKLPVPVSTATGSNNFMVGALHQETVVSNTSNIYWQMTIYDYVARQDTTLSPVSLASGLGVVPLAYWQLGLKQQTTAATQSLFPWSVNATPFSSTLFCQFYKVIKSTKVMVGPGATHTHILKNNVNRVFYPSRFGISSGNIRGMTAGSIYVCVGQPVESTKVGVTYPVTTGIIDGTVVTKIKSTASQKYVNKVVFNPETSTSFYQETASVGLFKALLDNSLKYEATVEGG